MEVTYITFQTGVLTEHLSSHGMNNSWLPYFLEQGVSLSAVYVCFMSMCHGHQLPWALKNNK